VVREQVETADNTVRPGHPLSVAEAIVGVARELARTLPPPRGAPYFCLDADAPYDLGVLDAFYGRGIFRKYEFALELGSRLGGRARWLAARSGCRVLGVDPQSAFVAAAGSLNRRACMTEQVAFQVGCLEELPLRSRVFTHVWMIDVAEVTPAILAEAFRVLRPGAHFAVQRPALPPGGRAELPAALRAAGFVELEARDALLADPPQACRVAAERWRRTLPKTLAATVEGVLGGAARPRAVLQVFARRPA
jgi:SAM-dependent methyltransferase